VYKESTEYSINCVHLIPSKYSLYNKYTALKDHLHCTHNSMLRIKEMTNHHTETIPYFDGLTIDSLLS
jgi:hypothetical protein